MSDTIKIEVVFATPERQELVALEIAADASVADAVAQSRLQAKFPDVDLHSLDYGIWGRQVEPEQTLEDGDRVEIYRPLQQDPRDARRALAKHQRFGSSS